MFTLGPTFCLETLIKQSKLDQRHRKRYYAEAVKADLMSHSDEQMRADNVQPHLCAEAYLQILTALCAMAVYKVDDQLLQVCMLEKMPFLGAKNRLRVSTQIGIANRDDIA